MNKICDYSDSSGDDDDADGGYKETPNYFGLSNDPEDEPKIRVCEHDIVIVDNAVCWKCQMLQYQKENLTNNQQCFGPEFKQVNAETTSSRINFKRKRNFDDFCEHLEYQTDVKRQASNDQKSQTGHAKCISELQWHPMQASANVLLSCSLDGFVKLWDIQHGHYDRLCERLCEKVAKTGISSAKWSNDGTHIYTADFDCHFKTIDAVTGREINSLKHDDYITNVHAHPDNQNIVLCGSKGAIISWDIRSNSQQPAQTFCGNFGQVRDIAFIGNNFVCCTDTVERESADRTIMVWDFNAAILISNQIYHERYSCTALRLHPTSSAFLAQSNANYIAIFSTKQPFKINKTKRFEGHKVSGYGITFDIDPSGSTLISGSSDGKIYYYNYWSGKNFRTRAIFDKNDAAICVKINEYDPSLVAISSWTGNLYITS